MTMSRGLFVDISYPASALTSPRSNELKHLIVAVEDDAMKLYVRLAQSLI
jgi:hypothetical protein